MSYCKDSECYIKHDFQFAEKRGKILKVSLTLPLFLPHRCVSTHVRILIRLNWILASSVLGDFKILKEISMERESRVPGVGGWMGGREMSYAVFLNLFCALEKYSSGPGYVSPRELNIKTS